MHHPAVERLDHLTINVSDLARAKQFYGGLFGLPEIPRPKSFTFGGAWYRIGAVALHLVQQRKPDPDSRRHFALWVSDVRAAARALEAAAYPVQWDTFKIEGVDRFFTRDPDGNRVEVQGAEA